MTEALIAERAPVTETKRGTCPICGVGCYVEAKIAEDRAISIRPDRTAGLPDYVGPAHAASVGLLMRSDSVAVEFGPLAPRRVLGTGTGYMARVGQWIRESF